MSRRRPLLAAAMNGLGLTTAITAVAAVGAQAGAADLPVVVIQRPDPMFDALTVPENAAIAGAWGNVVPWPLLAIHSALLPNGTMITYDTPGNESQAQQARVLDVWDPWQGTARSPTSPSTTAARSRASTRSPCSCRTATTSWPAGTHRSERRSTTTDRRPLAPWPISTRTGGTAR